VHESNLSCDLNGGTTLRARLPMALNKVAVEGKEKSEGSDWTAISAVDEKID